MAASTPQEPPPEMVGRLHWHHAAHRELTGRQMYFWFLAFSSLYSQSEVLDALEETFDEFDIRSYMTYELLGTFDILARVYLPPSMEGLFDQALQERLGPLGLQRHKPFFVEDVLYHWVWAADDKPGRIDHPDKQLLRQHFAASEIALINRADDQSPIRNALVNYYAARTLVRQANRVSGIKFIMTIGSDEVPDNSDRQQVARRIANKLNSLNHLLIEHSLYVGRTGQRELFLVVCRIPHAKFHQIRDGLLDPLSEAVGRVNGRTITFPVVSADFLCFKDELAIDPPPQPDVVELLQGEETAVFEVKGSLLAPLDPWLLHGSPITESASYPYKSVLKAIGALLNSGGGTLVIGALEDWRYAENADASGRLATYPVCGPYRVVGLLDPTYTDSGWDAWEKRLTDLLAAKLDPSPGVLVQARRETVEGQVICVVEIDDLGDDADFWLRESPSTATFYARRGTSIAKLERGDIERHRKQMRKRRDSRRRK